MSGTAGGPPWPPTGRWPEPRIGDVEREGAVWALGEHYAVGRLTAEEHDERTAVAWRARTHSELAPLFRDLPQPHGRPVRPVPVSPHASVAQPPVPPSRGRRGGGFWLGLLLVLVVLIALFRAPPPLVLLLGLLVVYSHRPRRHDRGRGGCGGRATSHQR